MDLSVEFKQKSVPATSALPAPERSQPERSEGDRSAGAGKADPDLRPVPRPDPEFVARPRRRTFDAVYKRRILEEADSASFSGSIGRGTRISSRR